MNMLEFSGGSFGDDKDCRSVSTNNKFQLNLHRFNRQGTWQVLMKKIKVWSLDIAIVGLHVHIDRHNHGGAGDREEYQCQRDLNDVIED